MVETQTKSQLTHNKPDELFYPFWTISDDAERDAQ